MDVTTGGTDRVPTTRERLAALTLRDEARLGRRLHRAGRGGADADPAILVELAAAEERVARRRRRAAALVPVPGYPDDLPITAHRGEIAEAIRDHQVVVLAGETGSGKTTQLPKICLDLGRGVRGTIGHTQPRRIAARSVAERVAEELGVELGGAVGYRIRFGDRSGEDTLVRLMTDGILLAETRSDPRLLRYDTVIIDEAHERSLTIDFLLGYLHRLLPRRPDLRVVVTSATIDPERFSRHFGGAPIIEVSGRTYPVEIRYRPYGLADERDQTQAIVDAIDELDTEPDTARSGPGDVLVFLSGEREIRDTADALRRGATARAVAADEVLPLYGRLSSAEQHKVFAEHPGTRRIVLATNVAETSLTVPGIRYVVDPGTARISRYSRRTKVQRLPIEPISQASARQRAGRCGRLSDGVAIRLYGEEDHDSRPLFTDPEILRTNLASVLLQMAALDLGDIEDFPFIDPPDRRSVRDGVSLLAELGAVTPPLVLTPLGRRLAQLPVDPRIGRMILAAIDDGCLGDLLVLAAALTIQDPRERPSEPASAREAAVAQHSRFATPGSDFLSFLSLWDYLRSQQQELSSSAFRRLCRTEHLHYLRVREWQDLHGQLVGIVRGMGVTAGRPAEPEVRDPAAIHRCVLAGLLTHIGAWDPDRREYVGARGVRFAAAPGSAAARRPPRWVMAAELVETSRLWGRTTAAIEPEWVEPLAAHLVERSYSEPRWDRRRGAAVATERVTLHGLPLVTGRTVALAPVDPVAARELFLRHALVEGSWDLRPPGRSFVRANLDLRDELRDLEERTRRRGIVADDDALYALYDQRVPADVVSGRHFDTWWARKRRSDPELLTFGRAELLTAAAEDDADAFPDTWRARPGLDLPLRYEFDPGSDTDGVTVEVPVAVLPELSAAALEWQVPGLRLELVEALVRSLPKALRRSFVPAPTYAAAALERLPTPPAEGGPSLRESLAEALSGFGGPRVRVEDFDVAKVPDHLRMAVRVRDPAGRELAVGRDLAALQVRYAPRARTARAAATTGVERTGLTAWTLGTLPRDVTVQASGHSVTAYPALVDEGATVGVRVFATPAEQRAAMLRGTRRLLLITTRSPAAAGALDTPTKLLLMTAPHGSAGALLADVRGAILDEVVVACGGPPWDADGFRALHAQADAAVGARTGETLARVARVLAARRAAEEAADRVLSRPGGQVFQESAADVRDQVTALVHDGFVTAYGTGRLDDLVRYLSAATYRLDRLDQARADPQRAVQRDLATVDRVHAVTDAYAALLAELPPARRTTVEAQEVRWMIEELRVSLFAQGTRTAYPISEKRIGNAMAALRTPVVG